MALEQMPTLTLFDMFQVSTNPHVGKQAMHGASGGWEISKTSIDIY